MKRILQTTAILATLLVTILLLLACVYSPQKTAAIKSAPNSITVVEDIELNGVSQRIVIRGKDINNPVLLHLHGGPGGPDIAMLQDAGLDIEDLFTVCYWDERGAGASYHSDLDPESMTINQLADDGIALSKLLAERFDKSKIYLQGHSFGTVVGTRMAQSAPELFHSYIGIGQLVHTVESEILSYDFALRASQDAGDIESVNKLKEIGRPPYSNTVEALAALFIQRSIMWEYENPHAPDPLTMIDIYKLFFAYKGYSIRDKLNAIKGSQFSMEHLWGEILNYNLNETSTEWEIPVTFVQGKYDKHTVTALARAYFDKIEAPSKQYFEFEKSGHEPHLMEQERYRKVMESVID